MSDAVTKEMFARYIDAAAILAEQVKHNIKHNKCKINDDTILALNQFILSALAIKSLTDEVKKGTITLN